MQLYICKIGESPIHKQIGKQKRLFGNPNQIALNYLIILEPCPECS